jgi:osmotically-inducible protein OsmY
MPSKKDAMLTIQAAEPRPTKKIHITPFTITGMAEWKLHSKPYLALKNVSCDWLDDVLVLRGCLPSYYLKQVAQEVVARLDGVERIDNQIQVMRPSCRSRQDCADQDVEARA